MTEAISINASLTTTLQYLSLRIVSLHYIYSTINIITNVVVKDSNVKQARKSNLELLDKSKWAQSGNHPAVIAFGPSTPHYVYAPPLTIIKLSSHTEMEETIK